MVKGAFVLSLLVFALVALGALAGFAPGLFVLLIVAAGLVYLAFARPALAAYIYTAALLLVVGFNRGTLLPAVRINEAILAAFLLGCALRLFLATSARPQPRLHPVDLIVCSLVVAGSLLPIASALARSQDITTIGLGYALVFPKLAATYGFYRLSVRSLAQVRQLLVILTATLSAVAALGVAQTARVPPVENLLSNFGEFGNPETSTFIRAASTIGSPLAFADLMVIGCALAIGWMTLGRWRIRGTLLLILFAAAAILSGQVSALIGLCLLPIVAALLTRNVRRVFFISACCIIVLAPALLVVLDSRLTSVDPTTGLPSGWTGDAGRVANLTNYIFPHFSNFINVVFGVQLAAQLPSPYPWAEWLYIESGYTYALWIGGIPLLLVVILLFWFGLKSSLALVRQQEGSNLVRGVASAALLTFSQASILMWFDPHLTYRGSGDLFFIVAALLVRVAQSGQARLASVNASDVIASMDGDFRSSSRAPVARR